MTALRQCHLWALVFALISISVTGAARAAEPPRPEPQSLERAAPELIEKLRADPYNYFRFVNRSWITRVCEVFARDLEQLPIVRSHGDAHGMSCLPTTNGLRGSLSLQR